MATNYHVRYRDIWLRELQESGWDHLFDNTLAHKSASNYRNFLDVFDISTSGTVTELGIDIPSPQDDYQDFVTNGRNALSSESSELATRIIVMSSASQIFVRDVVGVHYSILPAFFRDIELWRHIREPGGQRRGDKSWKLYDLHMPDFTFDTPPTHLHLGKGCVAYLQPKSTRGEKHPNIIVLCLPRSKIETNILTAMRRSTTWTASNWPSLLADIYSKDKQTVVMETSVFFSATLHSRPPSELMIRNEDPLLFIQPVLEFFYLCSASRLAVGDHLLLRYRFRLDDTPSQDLSYQIRTTWNTLAEISYDGGRPLESFRQFDALTNQGRSSQNVSCKKLLDRFDIMLKKALHSEDFAREMLQAYNSNFALEDSKASLRQARAALDDSQRSRLLSILAFIYVPISLGTSIFGMNLAELNSSGQPIWIFGLTTGLLTLVSTLVWAVSFQWHIFYNAPESTAGEVGTDGQSPIPGLERLSLLIKLITHGHFLWAWNSGIIFSLWTNGRKAFKLSCRKCHAGSDEHRLPNSMAVHMRGDPPHDEHAPCAYIRAHLNDRLAFRLVDPDLIEESYIKHAD